MKKMKLKNKDNKSYFMYLKVLFKLNANIPKRILKMKEHLFKNSVLYVKLWYLNKDSPLHILVQKQSDKPKS